MKLNFKLSTDHKTNIKNFQDLCDQLGYIIISPINNLVDLLGELILLESKYCDYKK